MRKTLAHYHKKYPARPGDTVEQFEKYEEFCKKDPQPKGDGYLAWYERLCHFLGTHAPWEKTP